MKDIISNLTADQARELVFHLAEQKNDVAKAIIAAAEELLMNVDIEEVADEVYGALEFIIPEDCWDRAGSSRDGYMDAGDAAFELIEEALEPEFEQVKRYRDLGMYEQERDCLMGIVLGGYSYEKESESEFKDWCPDMVEHHILYKLEQWRKQKTEPSFSKEMDAFLKERCPDWAK